MKKFKALFIVLLFLISSASYGLDTNSIKYMPLHVGDYWVYNSYTAHLGIYGYWISKCTVTSSVVYNNHLYYNLYSDNTGLFNGYFRVDSSTGSLYKYDSTNSCQYYYSEKLYDSLAANIGDSINNCAAGKYKCTGINPYYLFSDSTNKITFYDYYQGLVSGNNTTKVFVKKYGVYSIVFSAWGGGPNGSYAIYNTLKGCKINGIRYGDTTLTSSTKTIISSIPETFILYQNYPNPFNPNTVIRFSVPLNNGSSPQVVIKVYDMMGREVQILVNKRFNPGTYETKFNGSNFPSGVYFYKLQTENYTETKRMLLIK